MQKSNDQMMMSLEEKRINIEERQMEIDVQMCRKERQFHLQMMQMLMQQNMTHPMPPPMHYPIHYTFNLGLTCITMNLTQMKPKMDYRYCKHVYNYFISYFAILIMIILTGNLSCHIHIYHHLPTVIIAT